MNQYIKEVGKKGFITYKCKNKYIYSPYEPFVEAKRFIETQNLKETVITICGADFVNSTLLEKNIYEIISFEPIQFEILSNDQKIKRFKTINEIKNYLYQKNNFNVSLIFWQPLIETNTDIYLNSIKELKDFIEKNIFSKNTEKYFGFIETKNFLKNIQTLGNINILTKKSKNIDNPAIIISSGFSLNDNIEFLQKTKDYCHLFALPSSLPYLYEKKIFPDFAMAVDPGYGSFYHISKYKNHLNLLSTLNLHPSIFRLKNINPIFFSYSSILENMFFDNTNVIISYPEGSVFLNLLRLLIELGFKKIILIGQDFGFKDGRSHIFEGFFEKEFFYQSDFFSTMEDKTKKIESAKDITFINDGEKEIKTDRALKIYYNHFLGENFATEIFLTDKCFNNLSNKYKKIDIDYILNNFIKKEDIGLNIKKIDNNLTKITNYLKNKNNLTQINIDTKNKNNLRILQKYNTD